MFIVVVVVPQPSFLHQPRRRQLLFLYVVFLSIMSSVLPPNLAAWRKKAFELKNELTFSPDEFRLYWPFIENVWFPIKQRRVQLGGHTRWQLWCRCGRDLQKNRDNQGGSGQRRRKVNEQLDADEEADFGESAAFLDTTES